MAQRGGQRGNRNATKNRPWTDAIRRALARADGTVDKGLDALADKLVAKAKDGDAWARDEIAGRVEGRVPQAIEHSGEVTHVRADGLTDDALADIATGSGAGTAEASSGTEGPGRPH